MRSKLLVGGLVVALGFLIATNPVVVEAATSITGKDIKNESVTSRDIKDRSLLAQDFAAGQLPAGAPGPQGPQGPQGVPGTPDTSNFYTKAASDARFLGVGAKAADAESVDGVDSTQLVHGNGRTASHYLTLAPDSSSAYAQGDLGDNLYFWYYCAPSASYTLVNVYNATGSGVDIYVSRSGEGVYRELLSSGGTMHIQDAAPTRAGDLFVWSIVQPSTGKTWTAQTTTVRGVASCVVGSQALLTR